MRTKHCTVAETGFPRVSIITIVYNNVLHIRDAIESVLSQDYLGIEYVMIDAGSTDGTVEIIKEYGKKIAVFISEPDDGIYDALNKGIRYSSGDIIGILHSDDLFCDERVVSDSIRKMRDTDAELCFSDMVIVDNISGKIIRYYMAHYFRRWMFRTGWMPPHPTIFINKSLFDEFGLYTLEYKIAGDFDFLVRIFYGRKIDWVYLDRATVKMMQGGISNSGLFSKFKISSEINKVLRKNNVWSVSILQVARYVIRMVEIVKRP